MAELSHGLGVVSVWIVGVVEDGLIFAIVLDETVGVGDEHVQNDTVWVVRIGINQLSTMPTPLDIHVVVGRLGNTFAVDPGLIGLIHVLIGMISSLVRTLYLLFFISSVSAQSCLKLRYLYASSVQ